MNLKNIENDVQLECANAQERKEIIKILEGHEWDLVYPKRSFMDAGSINLYAGDKRFQTTGSNLFRLPVISGKEFIAANEI